MAGRIVVSNRTTVDDSPPLIPSFLLLLLFAKLFRIFVKHSNSDSTTFHTIIYSKKRIKLTFRSYTTVDTILDRLKFTGGITFLDRRKGKITRLGVGNALIKIVPLETETFRRHARGIHVGGSCIDRVFHEKTVEGTVEG